MARLVILLIGSLLVLRATARAVDDVNDDVLAEVDDHDAKDDDIDGTLTDDTAADDDDDDDHDHDSFLVDDDDDDDDDDGDDGTLSDDFDDDIDADDDDFLATDDTDDVSEDLDFDDEGADVSVNKRILLGPKTDIKEFPWLVGIKRFGRGGIICGGSLIAKDVVLTASHCFYGKDPATGKYVLRDKASGYRVVTKQSDMGRIRRDHVYKVAAVRVHKDWDVTQSTKSPNDIAILKLTSPVKLDAASQLIALPNDQSDSPPSGSECHVAGWGRTQKGRGARNLYSAVLKTDPMSECINWFGGAELRTHHAEKRLCAGGESTENVCKGDSGGPFTCKRGIENVQYGVVSFGSMRLLGCYKGGNKGKAPSVYTRVSFYLDWIKKNSM
ncbi:chymotrypsin-like elastase family member 2A [Lineus longissimus]|uniref:chymotrypsin-like elastase family member 2A n=1 Tax=Lineus longissimus TaxID=88925 RepID=UPI002B4DD470